MRQKINTVLIETSTDNSIKNVYVNGTEVLATNVDVRMDANSLIEVTIQLLTFPNDFVVREEND